jgi:putative FmdB family regulatory protein
MPLYEYECDSCGHRFEVIQKFSDPLIDTCPKCGSTVHKLMSSPAIQFKGSGFYITDYPKKESGGGAKSSGGRDKDAPAAAAESSSGGAEKSGTGASAEGKSEKSSGAGSDSKPAAAPATAAAAAAKKD